MSRQTELLEIIVAEGRVSVVDLSKRTGVSQVTIRKDLDDLVNRGLIIREHGYAVPMNSEDIAFRCSINYAVKREIAKLAAKMVNNGDAIMIESGSSCALLAEELARTKRDIVIITNSAFIAAYIRSYPNIKVSLLGGDYQHKSQVCIGPMVSMHAEQYRVDKIFVGTDGFTVERGFTGSDIARNETVRNMAKVADKVIILSDSSKFNKTSLVNQFQVSDVYAVITDEHIDEDMKRYLESNDIQVSIAKV